MTHSSSSANNKVVSNAWSGIHSNLAIFLDDESKVTNLISPGLKALNPLLILVDREKLASHVVLDSHPRHLKINLLRQNYLLSLRSDLKIVTFEWIFECARQGRIVSEDGFELVDEKGRASSKREERSSSSAAGELGGGGAKMEPSSESPEVPKGHSVAVAGSKKRARSGPFFSPPLLDSEPNSTNSKKSKVSPPANGNASTSTAPSGVSYPQHRTASSSTSADKGNGRSGVEHSAHAAYLLNDFARLRAACTSSSSSSTPPKPQPSAATTSSSSSSSSTLPKGAQVGERLPGCVKEPYCHWCGLFPPDRTRFVPFETERGEKVKGCTMCQKWLDEKIVELGQDSKTRAMRLLVEEGERRRRLHLGPRYYMQ